MNFIHEMLFLRCKWAKAEQATDIMSSMQCTPFLSAWPTSAPEIEALRSLLPILFCYFIAPATALETGGGKEGSQVHEVHTVHTSSPLTTSAFSLHNWTSESTEQCFVLYISLIIMADPLNCSNRSELWMWMLTGFWPVMFSVFSLNGTLCSCFSVHLAYLYSCWCKKNGSVFKF